jgi:hypothetical protein
MWPSIWPFVEGCKAGHGCSSSAARCTSQWSNSTRLPRAMDGKHGHARCGGPRRGESRDGQEPRAPVRKRSAASRKDRVTHRLLGRAETGDGRCSPATALLICCSHSTRRVGAPSQCGIEQTRAQASAKCRGCRRRPRGNKDGLERRLRVCDRDSGMVGLEAVHGIAWRQVCTDSTITHIDT